MKQTIRTTPPMSGTELLKYISTMFALQLGLFKLKPEAVATGPFGSLVWFLAIVSVWVLTLRMFIPYRKALEIKSHNYHPLAGLYGAAVIAGLCLAILAAYQIAPILEVILHSWTAALILLPGLLIPAWLIDYANKLYIKLDPWGQFVFAVVGIPVAAGVYLWASGNALLGHLTFGAALMLLQTSNPYVNAIELGCAIGIATGLIAGISHPVLRHFAGDALAYFEKPARTSASSGKKRR